MQWDVVVGARHGIYDGQPALPMRQLKAEQTRILDKRLRDFRERNLSVIKSISLSLNYNEIQVTWLYPRLICMLLIIQSHPIDKRDINQGTQQLLDFSALFAELEVLIKGT